MKILLIHRNYFPDGGDSTYTIKLACLLKDNGHDVSIFTIEDNRNIKDDIRLIEFPNIFSKSKKSKYSELNIISKIRYGINSLFSVTTYKSIKNLLSKEKYDIIHLQNIHHVISPSILLAIKKFNVPVLWTLHDYKLLCPSSNYFCRDNVCEKCNNGKYYFSFINRCKRDSWIGSFLIMVSAYLEKFLKTNSVPKVFITPSKFLKDKLIQNKYSHTKIINLPNFIENNTYIYNSEASNVLYYGNLAREKGVHLLLEIARKLPELPFLIIGKGPLQNIVDEYVRDCKNITFLKYINNNIIYSYIKSSKFVIVPSQWYENFPFTVLEPISLGKTVIASNVGGIPEIIFDNYNGILIKRINYIDEWCNKITKLYYDSEKIKYLEGNAYKSACKYNSKEHYIKIINIYESLIS